VGRPLGEERPAGRKGARRVRNQPAQMFDLKTGRK
jgi:hypothetical protein